jgi:AcrR family transcriptional regulator
VFSELGYFDTRVDDIASRAKMSRVSFYTYFESKDAVLAVLVAELVDDLFEASAAPLTGLDTPYETLGATIRQFMHAYRDRAAMIRVLEQAVAVSDEFLAIRIDIRARFGRRLARSIHTRDGVALDPELAAYALGGMVDDFARGAYLLNQVVDEDAAIATMATIWARALGVPTDH